MSLTQITTQDATYLNLADSHLPPLVNTTNEDIYVITRNVSGKLEIRKSGNNGSTFGSPLDNTNAPTISTKGSIAWLMDGTTIKIAYQTNGVTSGMDLFSQLTYHDFSTSTDTWGTTNQSVHADIDYAGGASTTPDIDIALGGTGNLFIMYRIDDYTTMGTSYIQKGIAKYSSGSWGLTNQVITGTNTGENMYSRGIAGASVDGVHCNYRLATTSTTYRATTYRTAWSTSYTMVSTGADMGLMMRWNDGTTDYVMQLYDVASGVLYALRMKEDASNDIASDSSAAQIFGDNTNTGWALVHDPYGGSDEIWAVFADVGTDDLWANYSANGATTDWKSSGSRPELEDAVSIQTSFGCRGATIYQYSGGTYIGYYVYDNPSTVGLSFGAYSIAAGGTTTYKTIAASSTMTPSISKVGTWARTLAASSTVTAAMSRVSTWYRTIAASSTVTAAMSRVSTWYRTIAATTTAAAALAYGKLYSRTIAATSTVTAAVSKVTTYARTLAATSTVAAALSKVSTWYRNLDVTSTVSPVLSTVATWYKTIAATTTAAAALAKTKIGVVAIAASSTMTAALAAVQLIVKQLDVTSTMTPALTKVATFYQTIAASTTVTAALTKVSTWYRTLAATTTVAVTMTRKMFKTLAVTTTVTAALSAVQLLLIAINATSAMTAQISTVFTAARTIAATSTMTPAVSRAVTFLQTVAASSTMTAAVQRTVGLTLSATMSSNVSITRKFFKTLAVSTTVTPTVITVFVAIRAIDAAATLVAALSKVFIPAGPPPSWSFAKWLGSPGRTQWSGKDD